MCGRPLYGYFLLDSFTTTMSGGFSNAHDFVLHNPQFIEQHIAPQVNVSFVHNDTSNLWDPAPKACCNTWVGYLPSHFCRPPRPRVVNQYLKHHPPTTNTRNRVVQSAVGNPLLSPNAEVPVNCSSCSPGLTYRLSPSNYPGDHIFHEYTSVDQSQSGPTVNAGRSAGSEPQTFSRVLVPETQSTLSSLCPSPLPPPEKVRHTRSDHLYNPSTSNSACGKNRIVPPGATTESGSPAPDDRPTNANPSVVTCGKPCGHRTFLTQVLASDVTGSNHASVSYFPPSCRPSNLVIVPQPLHVCSQTIPTSDCS
ncbi:hypothetical protein P691DRAFT_322746 [Macrolepiota fuliginosa MF-IS2]|uniref:Uncharacterized protein n=1 Tax=Macrolepiota fuliginosa MF-IS2 TaxID=1400762 RepID=A0A9P5XK13_9AGAR|nr:hypothetical protein P691DRAFT_322746 [Macrolepiota fuliginosa MF-IS2]